MRRVIRVIVAAIAAGGFSMPQTAAAQDKPGYEYRVLATSMTHTMTVAKTAFGGKELVAILRRLEDR